MRTNIDIDDDLMERARIASGLPTKKATVVKALETLIRLSEQKAILDLAGKVEFWPEVEEEQRAKDAELEARRRTRVGGEP